MTVKGAGMTPEGRGNDSEAKIVIPEKSGIHSFLSSPRNRGSRNSLTKLDSRLRGNDTGRARE
jgi:hypothetical protein